VELEKQRDRNEGEGGDIPIKREASTLSTLKSRMKLDGSINVAICVAMVMTDMIAKAIPGGESFIFACAASRRSRSVCGNLLDFIKQLGKLRLSVGEQRTDYVKDTVERSYER
jgi:hypothetical protein